MREITLRQVYKAMLNPTLPKIKGQFWQVMWNKLKKKDEIIGACAIGRAAYNLDLDGYRVLAAALKGITIKTGKTTKSGFPIKTLRDFITWRNDQSDATIEKIAEEMTAVVDLDTVIRV